MQSARAVTALAVCDLVMCDLVMVTGAEELPAESLSAQGLALAPSRPDAQGMAHASVKLWPGRSEQALQGLADAIARDMVDILGCKDAFVSVAIQEIPSEAWKQEVYDPDIRGKRLAKPPGYSM